MTPQEQYWKNRCEAAEAFIVSTTIMEKVDIEGKDDQRQLLDRWNVIFHTPEPPAPAQGVEEAELIEFAKSIVEAYFKFAGIMIYAKSKQHPLLDKDLRQLLRIFGEQIQEFPVNVNLIKEVIAEYNIKLAGSRWQQGQQPAPAIGARWVKGDYGRLYDLGQSGKRVPCYVDYDWSGDGQNIRRDIAALQPQTMHIGARGITYISTFEDEKFTQRQAFIIQCEQSNVEWLDESPCTFPTRVEAHAWALEEFMPNTEKRKAALAMYDWIVQQLKPRPTA